MPTKFATEAEFVNSLHNEQRKAYWALKHKHTETMLTALLASIANDLTEAKEESAAAYVYLVLNLRLTWQQRLLLRKVIKEHHERTTDTTTQNGGADNVPAETPSPLERYAAQLRVGRQLHRLLPAGSGDVETRAPERLPDKRIGDEGAL